MKYYFYLLLASSIYQRVQVNIYMKPKQQSMIEKGVRLVLKLELEYTYVPYVHFNFLYSFFIILVFDSYMEV